MKNKPNPIFSPMAVLGLSAAALVLRLCLYAFGTDEKGLLLPFHPSAIGLWVICALALTLAGIWSYQGSKFVPEASGPSPSATAGCAIMALAIAFSVLTGGAASALERISSLLGIAAAVCLVIAALCRYQGKAPSFLLYAVVCVFFALRAVCCYRQWCGDPQLQNYLFDMLATLLLMLFSYQQTAFTVGLGSRRMQLFSSTLALFCCGTALAHSSDPLLFAGGLLWTVTNFPSLTPKKED